MTTALYRRYRPQTFAEVIGQDHVTAPLRAALRSGQVNHAYLFSGPRGCGKTTSARILARVLNCERNTEGSPTDTPCGQCPSCLELATGGTGSLDVVEIDAASHNGVDDARELRERATYAPARDRYKVFILDEAHMVTTQAFNALLKLVEEPPPHVKFVFATTEPDKVIGTIRSRTHHYPFRLVPPDVLVPYLAQVCQSEGVGVGAGVLPLVVRAGAGSVRDSLSVLDQLIAGADEGGLEYEGAVALLGYTPAALLDDLVDAIAARDGATAFAVVERVVSTGHEPRRFVEDLLERLRDLIVIAASGDAAAAALGTVSADQLDRMRTQATHLGRSELSRSADLANTALTEMTGATSPRLQLELLMARLLLPAADDGSVGLGARLDRLERGWTPAPAGAAPQPAPPVAPAAAPAPSSSPTRAPAPTVPAAAVAPETTPTAAIATTTPATGPTQTSPAPVETSPAPAVAGGQDTAMLRRRWPEVLETMKRLRRGTWIYLGQYAQVQDLDSSVLRLSFQTAGQADAFAKDGHADVAVRAVRETLGFDVHVRAVVAATTGTAGSSAAPPTRGAPVPWAAPAAGSPAAAPATESSSAPSPAPPPIPAADADDELDDDPIDPPDDEPQAEAPPTAEEDDPSPDDPVIEGSNLVGAPLVARLLGGTVIDEQVEDPKG